VPAPSYEPAHCIVCGHADADVVAEQDDLRAEVEVLWAYHQRRLRPDTPPQSLMDRVAFSEHPPLRLVRCRECGLVYRNPVERAHELTEIYARTTPSSDVLRSLHDTQVPALRAQALALRHALGRSGAGLEVGSYVGAFLTAAREQGLSFEGLDINTGVNAFTRSLGFTVHDGELSSFVADRTFDAVVVWNTFDQLASPRAAVAAARMLPRAGGVLAIRVPNGAYYLRMRRRLHSHAPARVLARAVLAQNNLLTFPYRWGFSPRALARLLRESGFTVRRIRGDVLVPIADRWTKPWARLEESLIKKAMVVGARATPAHAPWFEIYASRD
jgi:2-polyprenyl-3-methyl-5-hydroxy-6-metoxy-1,4-benzoquinol methylase